MSRAATTFYTALVSLGLALLVQGCGFVSTPSLGAVCEAVADDSFVGVWRGVADRDDSLDPKRDEVELTVSRSGDMYTIHFDCEGTPSRTRQARLYRIGELTVAEIVEPHGEENGSFALAAVAEKDGVLGIRWLSSEWADNHLIANRHTFTCTVRSSPQQVLSALEEAQLSAFSTMTSLYQSRDEE